MKNEQILSAQHLEDERFLRDYKKRHIQAQLVWSIYKQHQGKAGKGVVSCPICQGFYHYVILPQDRYFIGFCETPGCLSISNADGNVRSLTF